MTPTEDELFGPDFLARLRRLYLVSKRFFRREAVGAHRDLGKGQTVEFRDYRPYSVGDDFRTIDWNIFARLDKLFVRLFESEKQLPVYILLDSSRSMTLGSPAKFRFARRLAAALAYIVLANQDRVSLFTVNDSLSPRLQTLHGGGEISKVMRMLASMEASGGSALRRSVERFSRAGPSPGVAVLISDFFDEEWEASPRARPRPRYAADPEEGGPFAEAPVLDALRSLLIRRHEVIALHVVCAEDAEPAFLDEVDLLDVETGARHPLFIRRDMLGRYRELFAEFVAAVEGFCSRHGIAYALAQGETPLEELIMGLIRRGALAR